MMSPIILFIYNRPSHTKQTLEALSANTLASESDLIIFADGPKENATQEQIEKIKQTREVAKSKQWCKSVEIRESDVNKGLAASIIGGVTEIVNKFGKIIVLEDDIVTGKYFLEYMNTALEKYENEKRVFHICGYRYPIKTKEKNGSYFYPVMDCWGWATWSDRWQFFKKDAPYYKNIFSKKMIKAFNMDGADKDKWSQIERNLSGKINTWAIFWGASIFIKNGLCLAPCVSLVKNVGLDNTGEHCNSISQKYLKNIFSIDNKVTVFPIYLNTNEYEYKKNKKHAKKIMRLANRLHFINIMALSISIILPRKVKNWLKKILKI